ncbi:hypothetical protein AND_003535 [Anopheles darlingi]|uniref:Uncharacterized protein n=1 Tax=Anopheles darlingi TaxID=43151 RepID=W5JN19_ANODA|nr:hypothetical protein AND_003535 [Anopheles darlingi]
MIDYPNATTLTSINGTSMLNGLGFVSSNVSFLNQLASVNGLLGNGLTGGNGSSGTTLLADSPVATVSYGFAGAPASAINGSLASPFLTTSTLLNINGTLEPYGGGGGGAVASNMTHPFTNFVHKEFIFDRTDVRVIFITLYSLVFCCCFFGE